MQACDSQLHTEKVRVKRIREKRSNHCNWTNLGIIILLFIGLEGAGISTMRGGNTKDSETNGKTANLFMDWATLVELCVFELELVHRSHLFIKLTTVQHTRATFRKTCILGIILRYTFFNVITLKRRC